MLRKKRQRVDPEIPSSSLADMAFLLLVFFLIVTTIDSDTGIGMVLPPPPEENTPPPPIRERNLLKILVNSQGLILINERPAAVHEVRERVIAFVSNNGVDPNLSINPKAAIVSIKTDRQTPYRTYISMMDEVRGGYKELRDAEARAKFGMTYDEYKARLGPDAEDQIKEIYPMNVSIAEPDKGTGN